MPRNHLLFFVVPLLIGLGCQAEILDPRTSSTAKPPLGGGGGQGSCPDTNCPSGQCPELYPGGPAVCLTPPPEVTSCSGPSPQCCSTSDCTLDTAMCVDQGQIPSCWDGTPAGPAHNICTDGDWCAADADCVIGVNTGDWICLPRGAFGYPNRECLEAWCRHDTDCNAVPGGACVLVYPSCCPRLPAALACVYPGGCAHESDCAADAHCDIEDGAGKCLPGPASCQ